PETYTLSLHDALPIYPEEAATHREEYAYYPTEWRSPFIDRRRKIGWDLYGLLKIGKTDKARMHDQHGRNYIFFDAPVGLMFTIEDRKSTRLNSSHSQI